MVDFQVEISGPGGCVNNVLVIVEKALREAGFNVTVKNKHPQECSVEDHLKFVEALKDKGHVEISMTHYPWGG